jgi:hypothetical protein
MIALSPRRRAQAWQALPCGLAVLGVAGFDLLFHEFWRDEASAMLEARAVPWRELVGAMRYEGIPPLFYAILKVAGVFLPNPLALVATGAFGFAVLLFGTYRLLVSISGAPRAAARLTLALSLTYAYGYELGVMIRQYALGLGLALLSFAYLRDALRATAGRRLVWAGALAAGLATLTSAHAACVAGAGALAFGLLSVGRRRRLWAWWPILLTLPCFALVAYLASPFPDRTAQGNTVFHLRRETIVRTSVQALVDGVMPVDWWIFTSLLGPRLFNAFAILRSLAFWGVLVGAAAGLAARLGRLWSRWRVEAFDLLAVLASWPPLLEILVRHYWGFYRHHLFAGMPLLVILVGWGLHARLAGAYADEARRTGLMLLAPWFLLQVSLAAGSLVLDALYPFSDTKDAARELARGAHVVSDSEWKTVGMLFWRPDIRLRAAGAWSGKPFLYIRADKAWHKGTSLPPLVREECGVVPDRTYFAGGQGSLGTLSPCARRVEHRKMQYGDHPSTWESFDLFRMDCACVGQRR